jgi:hypothetical protein
MYLLLCYCNNCLRSLSDSAHRNNEYFKGTLISSKNPNIRIENLTLSNFGVKTEKYEKDNKEILSQIN